MLRSTRWSGLAALWLGMVPAFCSPVLAGSPPKVIEIAREGRQPQAAVDPNGRIHVVYGLGNEIRYLGSTESGNQFENPVIVAEIPEKFALGMRRGPRIAASQKAIVVTAIGQSGPIDRGKFVSYSEGTLLAWRSTDGGRSWQGPSSINTVKGSAAEGMQGLTVAPDGTFFVTWNDNRSRSMEVYGSRSTDGGKTWTDETLVYRSPDKAICPCCHPSTTFAPDGTLYVMWRNQILGHRDLYLTRSTDGGKSFEPATKLGNGTWSFNACPMDGGSIVARARDSVETIWMREGRTFTASPGKAERSLGRGVQGWGVAGQEGSYFAWLANRPGKLNVLCPGEETPRVLAPSANDPMIAASTRGIGPVVAVWEITPETEATPKETAQDHGAKSTKAVPIGLAILAEGAR